MDFKVGDKVKILLAYKTPEVVGKIREIIKIDNFGFHLKDCRGYWSDASDFELITTKKVIKSKSMNKLTAKIKRIFSSNL